MKSREVDELLRKNSVDPATRQVCVALAQDISYLKQELMEVAKVLDNVGNALANLNLMVESNHTAVTKLQKMRRLDDRDDLPRPYDKN